MTHVILGLLLVKPMTFYDILRLLDQGISLFYSSSAGSAKRALNVLVERGEIEVVHEETTGRRRKTYAATAAGQDAFRTWMHELPQTSDLDTAVLSRVYFLGLMPTAERPQIIEGLLGSVAQSAARLDALDDEASAAPSAESNDLSRYALATLDYGQRAHKVSVEWLEELLATARAEAN